MTDINHSSLRHDTAAPGWYPHPQRAGLLRYWNGRRWTEDTAPDPAAIPVTSQQPQPKAERGDLVASGYLTALLFPFIGFIIGIILIIKGKTDHGVLCMMLSSVMVYVGLRAFSGGF